MLDASLHISAIPDQATLQPTPGRVPVALAALAVPERRGGFLPASWAASESVPAQPSPGVVEGDMMVLGTGAQKSILVRGLKSKGLRVAELSNSRAAAQVCLWPPSDMQLPSWCISSIVERVFKLHKVITSDF